MKYEINVSSLCAHWKWCTKQFNLFNFLSFELVSPSVAFVSRLFTGVRQSPGEKTDMELYVVKL